MSRCKLYLALIVALSLFVCLLGLFGYFVLKQQYVDGMQRLIGQDAKQKAAHFDAKLENTKKTVLTIAQSSVFDSMYKTNRISKVQKKCFLDIASLQECLMKLRFIDKNGNEVIRIDRGKLRDEPVYAPKESLQNKSDRYYTNEISKLKQGCVWVSNLDLNIEHGKVEMPYTPTLRVAAPVYRDGEYLGFVILSLEMEKIIGDLLKTPAGEIYLTDAQNDRLASSDKNAPVWTKYVAAEKNRPQAPFLPSVSKNANREMQTENGSYYYVSPLHKNVYTGESLFLTYKIDSYLQNEYGSAVGYMLSISLVLVLLGIIFTYFLSLIFDRLSRQMHSQEEMLIQESKLAAVGETVVFIAHQWRQPLNAVSSMLLRFRANVMKQKTNDKSLLYQFEQCENTLEHLSGTMENFKNFYAPNRKEHFFLVADTVNDALESIEYRIEKLKVNVKIEIEKNLSVYGDKGDLLHLFLALFNNSCDAFLTTAQSYPEISILGYKKDEKIYIEVIDNGGGIAAQILPTLFDRYSTTKTDTGGSGVGLYIARLIATKHFHGRIWVENMQNGARFVVELATNRPLS